MRLRGKKLEKIVESIVENSNSARLKARRSGDNLIPEKELNDLVQEIVQRGLERAGGMKGIRMSPRDAKKEMGDFVADLKDRILDAIDDTVEEEIEDFIERLGKASANGKITGSVDSDKKLKSAISDSMRDFSRKELKAATLDSESDEFEQVSEFLKNPDIDKDLMEDYQEFMEVDSSDWVDFIYECGNNNNLWKKVAEKVVEENS